MRARWQPIVATAACLATAVSSRALASDDAGRAALIARWASASHRSLQVLESSFGPRPPENLPRLVAAELATGGRYHLTPERPETSRPSLWSAFWTWVRDRWNDLWRAAFGRVRMGSGSAVALGDLLMGGVALLLLVVGLRLLSGLAIERRAGTRSQRLSIPPDASALYVSACAAAGARDYARATALLFAAAVAALTTQGLVRDDRSATVGDLRRKLRSGGSALVPSFDDVASAFVAGTYAERPLDASEWERAHASYLRLAADSAT